MILNKNFQNCYWFQTDALCSVKTHIATFYDIVHISTINWLFVLGIHMQISVPQNVDLI